MSQNRCDDEEQESKKGPLDGKIEDLLVNKRFIFLCGAVEDRSASEIIKKLWYLEARDPGKPILFIIHSPGGSVDSGFAIWDQIKMISSPVYTLVTGLAASMGSILSLCAAEGKRFSCPNARFMIHQPLIGGTIHGAATDLEIQAKEIIKTRDLLVKIYVEKTGKTTQAIEKALDRDTWMNAEEAKAFGLIDKIILSYKEIGF